MSSSYGPKFDPETRARLQGQESSTDESPSLKGFFLGLGTCIFMALVIPHIDFIIRHTRLTLNVLPASSMFFTMLYILVFNYGLARWRKSLALKKQDIALIFCMTMLTNPLPGNCGLSGIISGMLGLNYYSTRENNWDSLIYPWIPKELAPRDPAQDIAGPRPAEWFYAGMPDSASIPWEQLIGPFAIWCLALVMLIGMYFAMGALLQRQWSDRERLPFPLMQVPSEMWKGLPVTGNPGDKPFFSNSLVWWGIALSLGVHSWNAFGDYFTNMPIIPLRNTDMEKKLAGTAFESLVPLQVHIFPSVIALMYFVSLEVSFSLWFFFFAILKVCMVVAIVYFGMGSNGNDETVLKPFTYQGSGALYMLALVSLFMARGELLTSLRQALGLEPRDASRTFSPRTLWIILIVCFLGSIAWLVYFKAGILYATAAVLLMLLAGIGTARLVCEGGLVLILSRAWPANILDSIFPPAFQGIQNFVTIRNWSKALNFNEFRVVPMVNVMGALHAGSQARIRLKYMMWALVIAVGATLSVSFYSYFATTYNNPGGMSTMGYYFQYEPKKRFKEIADSVTQIKSYEEKVEKYTKLGQKIPASDIPDAAQVDRLAVGCLAFGMIVMLGFILLRTRIFWIPHPIGYVLWMDPYPMMILSFSFLLGWVVKLLVTKFGGQKVYNAWRPFFLGLLLGEALASIIWIVVAYFTGHTQGYKLEYQ